MCVMGLMIALAACGTGNSSTLPTLAPIEFEDTSDAATPTEPPAPTVEDPTPTPEALRQRPTLPPTWTPAGVQPTPTLDEPTVDDAPLIAPPPPSIDDEAAACVAFVIDRANSDETFRPGESPTVAWTVLQDERLRLYRLSILDAFGAQLYSRLLESTSHTIPAEIFQDRAIYGWEVVPIDEFGAGLCFGRGGLLDNRD